MNEGLRSLNSRMGPVARIAAVFTVIAVVVFFMSLRSIGSAVMTPSAEEAKKGFDDQKKKLAADYALSLDGQVKQFDGRSVFFIPSPPIPAPPPAPPDDHKEAPPPPAHVAPKSYGGPKIIAMINDTVWFDDGKKMAAGDDVKDKLKIKRVNAPWGATVEWDGVEFEVTLFPQDTSVYPPPKKEAPIVAASEAAKDSSAKEPAKETPPDAKTGDKPESPAADPSKPDAPKPDTPKPDAPPPETPKPESPDAPKPDQPEAPKPEQPKTDSPGSPEGQIEKHE